MFLRGVEGYAVDDDGFLLRQIMMSSASLSAAGILPPSLVLIQYGFDCPRPSSRSFRICSRAQQRQPAFVFRLEPEFIQTGEKLRLR